MNLFEKIKERIYLNCTEVLKGISGGKMQKEMMISYTKVADIINKVEAEHGWIPCSERLPEEGKAVLTCDKDGWISVNINTPYASFKNDFECGYYVAWMILPEPYAAST